MPQKRHIVDGRLPFPMVCFRIVYRGTVPMICIWKGVEGKEKSIIKQHFIMKTRRIIMALMAFTLLTGQSNAQLKVEKVFSTTSDMFSDGMVLPSMFTEYNKAVIIWQQGDDDSGQDVSSAESEADDIYVMNFKGEEITRISVPSFSYVSEEVISRPSGTVLKSTPMRRSNSVEMMYIDVTAETPGDGYMVLSQTLFNEDSNWEYWRHNIGKVEKVSEVFEEGYWDEDKDEWIDMPVKYVSYEIMCDGYQLVNDKGDVLIELPFEKMDGYTTGPDQDIVYIHDVESDIIYLSVEYKSEDRDEYGNPTSKIWVDNIYSVDKETSAVKVIARSEKTRMSVGGSADRGDILNIIVKNAGKGESVAVSDMTGRVIGRVSAREEGEMFSTANMSKGVYNVTLEGGQAKENRKIVIK